MITNYLASRKTRAPFCGLKCCGNSFTIHGNSRDHSNQNPKRLMRRYAKRAERVSIRREISQQLLEVKEDYYDAIFEAMEVRRNELNDLYEKWSDYNYDWDYDDYDYDYYMSKWCDNNDSSSCDESEYGDI